jgi:hypothetical protein
MAKFGSDQVTVGALSDLLLLTYAEQSARLRARQVGGVAQLAYERFTNWANIQAAMAFQTVTGEPVSVPAPRQGHIDELADAVLANRGPV